jgi:hypothetical protein
VVHPDLGQLSRIEEALLAAKLDAVRASLTHAGEKGRELEFQVRRLLREVLPPEYGLTTGFIAWMSPEGPALSSQLDIIIYDALRHSPLIHLEACDVVPLEAAYAYVEVKASLCSSTDEAKRPSENSIETCIARNVPIRAMKLRNFRTTVGSPMSFESFTQPWLSVRGYVVAFEAQGTVANSPSAFASRMATQLKRAVDAHLHGVLVLGSAFYYTRAIDVNVAAPEDYFHVRYVTEHTLLAFKSLLLQGLASFDRPPEGWLPATDVYLPMPTDWKEAAPASP